MPKNLVEKSNKINLKFNIYIVVILILCILLCICNRVFIVPSILLYIFIIFYTIWIGDKKELEIVNHIQEIASDVNIANRNTLINSPVPLLLIETDGTIIWKSKSFIDSFKDIDVITYLTPIIKEIKLNIEKEEKNQNFDKNKYITKQFNIETKFYKIYCGISRSKKKDKRKQREYQLTMYFIDDTKYNQLFDTYNNSKTCIGIAMIDNYEDVIQRALPEESTELVANVEKTIIDWAKETGGLIVKTDRDRYIYIVENQYIAKIKENKFDKTIADILKLSNSSGNICDS